jgi:hypothetical protein
LTVKAFASGFSKSSFAAKFGFDPATILAIIQMIATIFQNCKKSVPPGPSPLPVKLVHREMERIRKTGNATCPDRFRKAFAENGVTNRKTQDQMWCGLIGYSAGLPKDGLSFAE